MNIEETLNKIKLTKFENRIELLEDLIAAVNLYKYHETKEDALALRILDCISEMRSSKFIDTPNDLLLLDASIEIANSLSKKKAILIPLLKDAIYYSNYYPETYDKKKLESYLNNIQND